MGMTSDSKLNGHLVLVGATATGKSALALEVARLREGIELISADSMAVYKNMDIGTATPSIAERNEIPYHLISIVEPTVDFTVRMFQSAVYDIVKDLSRRNCRGIIVGGTGLHIRAVIDNLNIPPRYPEIKKQLETESDTKNLYQQLVELDSHAAQRMQPSNRRRIVRALEVVIGSGRPFSSFGPGLSVYPFSPFTQVGIRMPRDVVNRRIADRYQRQIEAGFLAEITSLTELPDPLSATASQALGYKELLEHLNGNCGLEEALENAIAATRRFARKQERWFRRDPRIYWIDVEHDPLEALPEILECYDRCALERENIFHQSSYVCETG